MKNFFSFILLAQILLFGCTHKRKHPFESLISRAKPQWFTHSKKYSITDLNGSAKPHLFFDIDPEINQKKSHINFVPLSISGSSRTLDIDIPSGQRFFTYNACMDKDLWKESKKWVNHWPFTVGFVPRILDQLGLPQKIIVFGGNKSFDPKDDVYYRVKILGGVVEQFCPVGRCTSAGSWLSRLDLIAVYEGDPEFENIKNIDGLVEKISWEVIKVAMENLPGGNEVGDKILPAVKIGRPLKQQEVMDYLLARNVNFSSKELLGLRYSCGKLYDLFWKDVGDQLIFDKALKTTEEVKEELRQREIRRSKKMPIDFTRRLHAFFSKYVDEFHTCSKFHYVGNINENPDRFWFLTYMNIFVKLHKEGFFYYCRSKSWQINPNRDNKDDITDLKEDMNHCSNEDIDLAFEYLELNLKGIKNQSPEFIRFIDYDNHELGTHQKVFSWVKEKRRAHSCISQREQLLKASLPIVPTEVKWLKRNHFDKKNDLGIID